MKNKKSSKEKVIFGIFIIILLSKISYLQTQPEANLSAFLPQIADWKISEKPRSFYPETLYEYINGGAEIYLTYNFQKLIVADYTRNRKSSLIVEIYDMGNEKNCFGIYSVERFPESNFISVGNQGYLDGESLNFIINRFYIKLLCYDCGNQAEQYLKFFAEGIVNLIKEKGNLPQMLNFFPQQGLIKNSEKFILRNFLGFKFLRNGYIAEYELNGSKFNVYIIEGENKKDAQNMYDQFKSYLKENNEIESIQISDYEGFIAQDVYYKKIMLVKVERYLCGILGLENMATGKKSLLNTISNIRSKK
ncbi:MAG: DUF6599 family protein [Candidatus Aminicenantia bacterium]